MNGGFQPLLLVASRCIVLGFAVIAGASHAADGPGAHVLASVPVVELPQAPIYWHLHTYPTRAQAAAVAQSRSAVVETLGKVWLFTIGEADSRTAGGTRVAMIGPPPVRPEGRYTASYMRAVTSPGFQTDVHQHGGPEALFTLSGEVCVETPGGKLVRSAEKEPLLINGDVPMQLTSGAPLARSDSSRRSTAMESAGGAPVGPQGPVRGTEWLNGTVLPMSSLLQSEPCST
jgi:hypothetical protein